MMPKCNYFWVSGAIRLVAKTLKKKALCDMYSLQIQDHFNAIRPWIDVKVFGIEGLEEKFNEVFIPEITEKFAPVFEKVLEKNPSGYLVGETLTWVDFHLADFTDKCITCGKEDIFENFPKLVAHRDKILSLPNLQEYLKSRPDYAI
uniref:glutathione transferase n=1 Tax=Acrobeloides nanus TaxID=290746 RepID=A0A914DQ71_9BILA